MAFGSTFPEEAASPATYQGMVAIVEVKTHVLDETDHTWPGEWVLPLAG